MEPEASTCKAAPLDPEQKVDVSQTPGLNWGNGKSLQKAKWVTWWDLPFKIIHSAYCIKVRV